MSEEGAVFDHPRLTLFLGDCRAVMAALPECSVDAIVTDPPYGIGFMGKAWDRPIIDAGASDREERGPSPERLATGRTTSGFTPSDYAGAYDFSIKGNRSFQAWCESWAAEARRILKPGGMMVVSGSPRTYHRLASGIEDAGFEIRDCLQWIFGQGFPKSLNLHGEWEGWGTALKPAYEPIVMARKPLAGTVAANVAAWGTGGLYIDGCRIGNADTRHMKAGGASDFPHEDDSWMPVAVQVGSDHGRWPANVLLDEEAAALLDSMSGATLSSGGNSVKLDGPLYGRWASQSADSNGIDPGFGDRGGASRFYYTSKTSRAEREYGLTDLEPTRRSDADTRDSDAPGSNNPRLRTNERRNDHPTVKPVDLMRWLCRLVTPPGGIVLDPFLGSGSTGMAALDEGFRFWGIDMESHYIDIARRRIARRHLLEPLPSLPTDIQPSFL